MLTYNQMAYMHCKEYTNEHIQKLYLQDTEKEVSTHQISLIRLKAKYRAKW